MKMANKELKEIKKHKCKNCGYKNSSHIYKTLFLCHDCFKLCKWQEKEAELKKLKRRFKKWQ